MNWNYKLLGELLAIKHEMKIKGIVQKVQVAANIRSTVYPTIVLKRGDHGC